MLVTPCQVLSLVNSAIREGVLPSSYAYAHNSLLSCCMSQGREADMLAMVKGMAETQRPPPNAVTYHILLDYYARRADARGGEAVLRHMMAAKVRSTEISSFHSKCMTRKSATQSGGVSSASLWTPLQRGRM